MSLTLIILILEQMFFHFYLVIRFRKKYFRNRKLILYDTDPHPLSLYTRKEYQKSELIFDSYESVENYTLLKGSKL